MKLLVCGAGGMLGHDVVRAAAEHEVTGLARADLDVTDAAAVRDAVAAARPDAVVNCAAWTDVDGAEDHEADATRVNGDGAGNVSAAAAEVGASVVYVSSDYVFDGTKDEPYVESDATAPLSAYGRSKLAGEVRHGRREPAPLHRPLVVAVRQPRRQLRRDMLRLGRERDELNVVDDQVGCPTWTGHLAEGLLDIARGDAYGIHHLAGAGECSWCEFAREIFRQANVACEVHPIGTDEYPRPARGRPTRCSAPARRPRAAAVAGGPGGVSRRAGGAAGMRLLVTGACGFIGSSYLRQAAAEHELVVLDKLTYAGRRENLEGLDVELVVGAIEDRGQGPRCDGGLRRGGQLRRRVTRGPLDLRPGGVRPHARDRHGRAARRRSRAGRGALPPGVDGRGVRVDRVRLLHRDLAARPLLALLRHQGRAATCWCPPTPTPTASTR